MGNEGRYLILISFAAGSEESGDNRLDSEWLGLELKA